MPKDNDSYVGRFRIASTWLAPPLEPNASLIQDGDPECELRMAFKPNLISTVNYVDVWKDGKNRILEVVTLDGAKFENYVEGEPLA